MTIISHASDPRPDPKCFESRFPVKRGSCNVAASLARWEKNQPTTSTSSESTLSATYRKKNVGSQIVDFKVIYQNTALHVQVFIVANYPGFAGILCFPDPT